VGKKNGEFEAREVYIGRHCFKNQTSKQAKQKTTTKNKQNKLFFFLFYYCAEWGYIVAFREVLTIYQIYQ
jgi:hypothetical protein